MKIKMIFYKRLDKIIKLIDSNSKILIKDIADNLKVSKRTIKRDINKLKEQKILQRIGNEKTGYWEIIHSPKNKNFKEKD